MIASLRRQQPLWSQEALAPSDLLSGHRCVSLAQFNAFEYLSIWLLLPALQDSFVHSVQPAILRFLADNYVRIFPSGHYTSCPLVSCFFFQTPPQNVPAGFFALNTV